MAEFLGALAGTFLLSRLFLWLSKKMGDNEIHILFAHSVTFGFAVIVGGYGFARFDEGPQFLRSAAIYALPVVFWLIVDFIALRGRRATKAEGSR